MIHELKTIAPYFQDVCDRKKTFEVRKDDRGYDVGDVLVLHEYFPETEHFQEMYTGRITTVRITYKLTGGQFGIEPGYCILGIIN